MAQKPTNPELKTDVKPASKAFEENAAKDQRLMRSFLNPMMEDLEKAMAENMKQLDKLEESLLGDIKKQREERLISHIPIEIRERKSTESILKNLESIILESTDKRKDKESGDVEAENNRICRFIQSKLGSNSLPTELELNPLKSPNESKLSEINSLACLSQSITAFLITAQSRKNGDQLKNLTIKLYDSVNFWLSRLFRFPDSCTLFHDQESDGLVRMVNMMLNFKYKDFQSKGYSAIRRQPAIYVSESSKYSMADMKELISIQLALPATSIRIVKVAKSIDNSFDKIDIDEFEKMIEKDIKDDFEPIILVANAGSYGIGQCDDLKRLNELCYKYNMWIHMEGFYLSSLALYSIPTAIQPVFSGDSITLNLPVWLGISSLSCVTLYRNVEKSNLYIQPFNSFVNTFQKCLPYWCVLQALGHEGVIERIRFAFDMGQKIQDIIKGNKPYLKIVDFKNTANSANTTEKFSISELISKAINILAFVDLDNPVVIFKCDQKYVWEKVTLFNESTVRDKNITREKDDFLRFFKQVEPFDNSDSKQNHESINQDRFLTPDIRDYTDTLTTWICDLLNSLNRKVEFDLIDIEGEGLCIRYSPLDHANIYETSETDISELKQSLIEIIQILDMSIKCRSKFDKEIEEFPNLVPIKISKWAGVGTVRFIPDYLLEKLDSIRDYVNKRDSSVVITDSDVDLIDLKPQTKVEDEEIERYIKDLNDINRELVKKLQSKDDAYTIGEDENGILAIKFGMVNDVNIIRKLASEVQAAGKEIHEHLKTLEKMNDLVRLGIEKAKEDLQNEKLKQESLLRNIPLINGIFNWLSPNEQQTTSGRTFNLQSGKIANTEAIYKYHMQIENESNETVEENKSKSERESNNDQNWQVTDANDLKDETIIKDDSKIETN